MRNTTLTSVDQLRDFVPGITEYVVIYYRSENVSDHYFGNFDESVQLNEDDGAIVRREMIMNSRVAVHENLISYILTSYTGNNFTIAFRDHDIENDNIRLEVIESDTQVLLVVYHRYIENHHQNHHQNMVEHNILLNMVEHNNLQNMIQNMIQNNANANNEEDNLWNRMENNHHEDHLDEFEE